MPLDTTQTNLGYFVESAGGFINSGSVMGPTVNASTKDSYSTSFAGCDSAGCSSASASVSAFADFGHFGASARGSAFAAGSTEVAQYNVISEAQFTDYGLVTDSSLPAGSLVHGTVFIHLDGLLGADETNTLDNTRADVVGDIEVVPFGPIPPSIPYGTVVGAGWEPCFDQPVNLGLSPNCQPAPLNPYLVSQTFTTDALRPNPVMFIVGQPYEVFGGIQVGAFGNAFNGNTNSNADFGGTALVYLQLHDGASFSAESGHDYSLPTPAPEPATLALLGIGLAGLGFSRRKQ